MTEKSITRNKLLLRRQLMNDIYELDLELSGLLDIIKMKKLLLQKIDKDACRRAQASEYLTLLPQVPSSLGTEGDKVSDSSHAAKRDSVAQSLALVDGTKLRPVIIGGVALS